MTNQDRKKHQMSFMLPIDTTTREHERSKAGDPIKDRGTRSATVDVEAARKLLIDQLERSGLTKRKG